MVLTKPSSTHTTFSLFNDLLPELRLKVYEFALVTPEPLCLANEEYLHQGEISPWSLSIFHGVALLRSSWKIYDEALPVFPKIWRDDLCASGLDELLPRFPQLRSFAFFFLRNYPRPPLPSLNEMAGIFVDLRQRVRSMTIIFDFHDEENLQRLRDVIAPHDEWRYQKDSYWHIYSIGIREQAGILNPDWPGCTSEEL